MIRLGCHSENFGRYGPEETFSFISRLGFTNIDVAARSLAPQSEIGASPGDIAGKLKNLAETWRLKLDELFLGALELKGVTIDPSAGGKAFDPEAYRCFDVICGFAKTAGFLSLMGAVGTENPELGYESSFENAAGVHRKMLEIAADHGLAYHVEPSRTSLLNTPQKALRMIDAVPSLRYTLDFLHYHINSVPLNESMVLLPYAGHMHARQAAAGKGKCDYALGEIDYNLIVKEMCRINWTGSIAMEFWNNAEQDAEGINPVEQNIRMKYELKCLIGKYFGYVPQ
ncbi:MAG: sugar phosphate isomerase/epimerase [Treponema sp.]|jgi:sugar phosphate isomerase/epimerase|nr:sugar phosphate isomerase/epimerase [Treponema sp.]